MSYFDRRVIRSWTDPHKAYKGLFIAAQLCGWKIIRVPMPGMSILGIKLHKLLVFLYAHWILAWRIRKSRKNRLIIREFLSLPLLIMLPIWFRKRNKCLFLVNHNLQKASVEFQERLSLLILTKIGTKFLLPENSSGWGKVVAESGAGSVYAIPIPLSPLPTGVKRSSGVTNISKIPVIGFVGNYRVEKNPEPAMTKILRAISNGQLNAKLLIGSGDRNFLSQWRSKNHVVIHETIEMLDYYNAICECDVIICSYDKNRYFYRPSGLVQDALACGTPIVVPNYDVIKDQISIPEAFGAVYKGDEDFIEAVQKAIDLRQDSSKYINILKKHHQHRSPKEIAKILDNVAQELNLDKR